MSATRADLDAKIATVITVVTAGFKDLLAKIDAGSVATPEDFTAEITSLQSILDAAVAADPGPQAGATPVDNGQVNPTVTVEPNA